MTYSPRLTILTMDESSDPTVRPTYITFAAFAPSIMFHHIRGTFISPLLRDRSVSNASGGEYVGIKQRNPLLSQPRLSLRLGRTIFRSIRLKTSWVENNAAYSTIRETDRYHPLPTNICQKPPTTTNVFPKWFSRRRASSFGSK